jgi:hypothetical protein
MQMGSSLASFMRPSVILTVAPDGADFSTAQAAVDFAEAKGTSQFSHVVIELAPGLFAENVVVQDPEFITIRGVGGSPINDILITTIAPSTGIPLKIVKTDAEAGTGGLCIENVVLYAVDGVSSSFNVLSEVTSGTDPLVGPIVVRNVGVYGNVDFDGVGSLNWVGGTITNAGGIQTVSISNMGAASSVHFSKIDGFNNDIMLSGNADGSILEMNNIPLFMGNIEQADASDETDISLYNCAPHGDINVIGVSAVGIVDCTQRSTGELTINNAGANIDLVGGYWPPDQITKTAGTINYYGGICNQVGKINIISATSGNVTLPDEMPDNAYNIQLTPCVEAIVNPSGISTIGFTVIADSSISGDVMWRVGY